MKKLIFSLLFIILYFGIIAQVNYKLKDYQSDVKAVKTFDKSISVNDIVLDSMLFYTYYLTNIKTYSLKGNAWTANSEQNVESLSSIIRSNIHNSGIFKKNEENDPSSDLVLNTYLQFWNSSLSGTMVYAGLGIVAELKNKNDRVIWNKHYYFENISMALKRKAIVQQFIDQLLKDLMALETENPEYRNIQYDIKKDTIALVVTFGADSKKARKKLEAAAGLADLQKLQGSEYVDDYFILYFKGIHIIGIDVSFDVDHKPKTLEDQWYRSYTFDKQFQIKKVIDRSHRGVYKRMLPTGEKYDSETVKSNIDNLLKEDAKLKKQEDQLLKSGKENELNSIKEQRSDIKKLITIYKKEEINYAELKHAEKEFWTAMLDRSIVIFDSSRFKAFRYFYK